MTVQYFPDLVQGTDEWFQARCGILTASQMCEIITEKTLKYADNKGSRGLMYTLMAQRLTKHVEPEFESYDMLRGSFEEVEAKTIYNANFAPVQSMGFIKNVIQGVTIGYSPDGLVGDDGLIECKSKLHKLQLPVILDNAMPDEFSIQVQTGLLVSERKWCDFISYSGGMPMFVKRVLPDPKVHDALIVCALEFEARMAALMDKYHQIVADPERRLIPTERKVFDEIQI